MWGDSSPMSQHRPSMTTENVFAHQSQPQDEIKFKKSLYYWTNQYQFLMDPNIVIFSAFSNFKIINIEIQEILKQLLNLSLLNNVEALYQLNNPAFYYIQFSSPIEAATFQNVSHQINGTSLFFLPQQNENMITKIVIEKIPVATLREFLPPLLDQWGSIEVMSPGNLQKPNGKPCATGQTIIHFKLRKDCTIMDIPYFIKIKHLRIYLHIAARPRICFRCESNEHLISECPMKFCYHCKGLRAIKHTCRESYAAKISVGHRDWSLLLQKVQEDANLLNFANSLSNSNPISDTIDMQYAHNLMVDNNIKPDPPFQDSSNLPPPSKQQPPQKDLVDIVVTEERNLSNSPPGISVVVPAANSVGVDIKNSTNESASNCKRKERVKTIKLKQGQQSNTKPPGRKHSKKACRDPPQELVKTYLLRNMPNNQLVDEKISVAPRKKGQEKKVHYSNSEYDNSSSSEDDVSSMDEGGGYGTPATTNEELPIT